MVATEFERIMLEHVSTIEKDLSANTAITQTLKSDINHIQGQLSDLCDRTTRMETQREVSVKNRDTRIKVLAIFSPIASVIVGIVTYFRPTH